MYETYELVYLIKPIAVTENDLYAIQKIMGSYSRLSGNDSWVSRQWDENPINRNKEAILINYMS